MEGHEQLAKVIKVRAPEGFEVTVLAKLPAARQERARARRVTAYRFAFAGSAALLLAGFLVFAPSSREPDAVLTYAEREALTAAPGKGAASAASRSRALPVYETMDYPSEFRNAQAQRPTIYILEQVSETRPSEIIY
ncbi:MAG TPA: hypothetical protein VLJ16_04705 [Acidobacteriota bacterium]|nr:hypothetical protein [Acidobacteriota bacterium]